MSGDRDSDWQEYYERTKGGAPRRTLSAALAAFGEVPSMRTAIDLGCGDGRDTIELLRRGWHVLAIDAEPAAIERLRRRADIPAEAVLATRVGRSEDETWPPADLVNASFSLPLCVPERFVTLWARIVESLKPGGRFAGQLFGDRDDWRGKPGMTFLERPAVDRLFDAFEVEMLEEEESDALTPYGKRKHWHLFHVVARKR